jgi:hypothetical protein
MFTGFISILYIPVCMAGVFHKGIDKKGNVAI